jgi:hypothetical protein
VARGGKSILEGPVLSHLFGHQSMSTLESQQIMGHADLGGSLGYCARFWTGHDGIPAVSITLVCTILSIFSRGIKVQ